MGIEEEVEAFAASEGRRPRIMVVKLGQDGLDRGTRILASSLASMGFDVDIASPSQTPEEAARQALDNDVHAVGVSSSLAGGHWTFVPRLLEALREADGENIVVVCGGIIPAQDHGLLRLAGVATIFDSRAKITDTAREILRLVRKGWEYG